MTSRRSLILRKKAVRAGREVAKPIAIRRLDRVNRHSSAPIVDPASTAVVSMTTHGDRVHRVHLTIESIARGKDLPRRIILWLDDPTTLAALPPSLQRLMDRGLEVKLGDNLGPHTKYFHSLSEVEGETLVTADDDILYPATWLSDLVQGSIATPGQIVCHLTKVIEFEGDRLAPYQSWSRNWSAVASPRVFGLGVSGIAYPPTMQAELRARGRAFMDVTPKADDIWLHYVALTAGIPVRQLTSVPTHFSETASAGGGNLSAGNVGGGGNDQQLAALYDDELVRSLGEA